MSAFGTKKPGADFGVQLTFPTVFADEYASSGIQSQYMPQRQMNPVIMPVGNDLQANYHQLKMEESHRKAMNGVKDTATARSRFLNSHAGYFGMPQPVLGQRLYANPSNGNQADIYSNRPMSGLRGGVLRTAEGQKWGHKQLQNRVGQLDAIQQAKTGFVMGQSVAESGLPTMISEEVSDKSKIDLVSRLQTIFDSLKSQRYDRLLTTDTAEMLKLLFRFSATASREDLEDVLEYLNQMEEHLRASQLDDINDIGMDDDGFDDGRASVVGSVGSDLANARRGVANLESASESITRAREYVAKMLAEVDRPVAERKKLSSALVKSLGFSKLGQSTTTESERLMVKNTQRFGERQDRIPPSANPFDRYDDNLFPSPLASRYVVGSLRPQELARESEEGRRQAITRRQQMAQREVLGSLRRQEAEQPRRGAFGVLGDVVSQYMSDMRNARFDPAPRNEFGDQAGRWFDAPDDWGNEADWSRRMGFRDPRDNQMEGDDEKVARERRSASPTFASSVYMPRGRQDEEREAEEDEDEIDEPQFFRGLASASSTRPPSPAVSAEASPFPSWLGSEYRRISRAGDLDQLRQLAVRLTREGIPIKVGTNTKWASAKRNFNQRFGKYLKE